MTQKKSLSTTDPLILIGIFITAKFLLHLFTNTIYGFHRDELLYMALGDHLMWGFQEVPPSIAVFAKLSGFIFSDTLAGYRFFPAVTGAATVGLALLSVRILGGKQLAILITGITLLLSPLFLRMNTLFQPVTFDVFYWTLILWLVLRVVNASAKPSDWIWLGVAFGLGMLNKYSIPFIAIPVALGLILTPNRFLLKSRWPWISIGIALLVWLPNLIWQIKNQFPVFDHMAELRSNQLVHVSALDFISGQVLLSLFVGLLFIPGLIWLIRSKEFRILAWIYGFSLLLFVLLSGKSYYLAGIYPILIAAGGVWFESWTASGKKWKVSLFGLLCLLNLPLVPYGLPLLPVDTMKSYSAFMAENAAMTPPLVWEDDTVHDLPQDYADMFGWEEQVRSVTTVYYNLPDSIRNETVIMTSNYGQAGALAHFGEVYNLPYPVSIASSFYFFGPGNLPGKYIIAVGYDKEDIEHFFAEMELKRIHTSSVARESRVEIWLCKNPKVTLQEAWSGFRDDR